MRVTIVCLLVVVPLSAQTRAPAVDTTVHGGVLTLVQDFGRARYSRCRFTVFYNQPPMPGTDRVELSCAPLPYPKVDDVATSRDLSVAEVALVAKLAVASDLYSGGHVGAYAPSGEGPWERLEVVRWGRHSLAVSLSEDEGRTWPWTRHLERDDVPADEHGQYHYPSIIQASDRTLHATYSFFAPAASLTPNRGKPVARKAIKHAHFNEAWIRETGLPVARVDQSQRDE